MIILSSIIIIISAFDLCAVDAFTAIDLSQCGTTKTCMRSDPSCTAATCTYLATWTRVNNYLEIELGGNMETSTGSGYMAIGFSVDHLMGDDSVIGCSILNGQMVLYPGYNEASPLSNTFLPATAYTSDYMEDQNSNSSLGGQYDATSNQISCRFRRTLRAPDVSAGSIFDLTTRTYYALLARGPSITSTGLAQHFMDSMIVSGSSINFTAGGASTQSALTYTLAKAHGCLMILAWVLFASIGIVMARYYKDMWPNNSIIGEKVWFILHVSCQIMCFLCVTSAFILIFCQIGGYSNSLQDPYTAHPILGIITFSLAFINPFIAAFRCKPNHPKRPIFNVIHFFVGTLAYVLAIPTMMLGLRLNKAGSVLVGLDYPLGILIAFVGFQVIVEFTLILHGCFSRPKYEKESLQMMSDEKNVAPTKVSPFKYVVAVVHAVVCVSCAVALVVIIAVN
jgi:hypothetical protein